MHNNTPIVPYVSLCSGYEGIGLGLHRCIPNLRCIAYCEREAFAVANLVAKMENGLLDAAPVFTDVTTFPWEQYAPYMAGGILSFGWPCQPVSCAGKRKATEDERWLFDIIADGIALMRPGLLFAENVEGLLSAKMPDGSLVFSHCIERLESLHYKVAAGIFSASEVGAPHQRKRIFILAVVDSDEHRIWPRLRWEARQGSGELHSVAGELADSVEQGLERFSWDGASGDQPGWQSSGPDGSTGEGSLQAMANAQLHGRDHANARPHADGIQGPLGQGHEHRQALGDGQLWPSRPGEQQFAWEPPRVVGNAPQQQDHGRESRDLGIAPSQWGCCNDAVDDTSEGMGDTKCERRARQTIECMGGTEIASTGCGIGKIESNVGLHSYGTSDGLGHAELSGLCDSELAEIREWMVNCDNRTDELRLLGNGVVPATAERAFRTLMEELQK